MHSLPNEAFLDAVDPAESSMLFDAASAVPFDCLRGRRISIIGDMFFGLSTRALRLLLITGGACGEDFML